MQTYFQLLIQMEIYSLSPNGSGEVIIPDDIFLTFGDSKDAKIEYDEDGDNRINVTGADWVYENGVAIVMARCD